MIEKSQRIKSRILLYSMDYSEGVFRGLPYLHHYVERSLCHLETLRNADIRLILITATPIDSYIFDYHFKDLYQMDDEQKCSAIKRLLLLSPQSK